MAQVRYIVNDVSEAVEFYVSKLGFELEQQFGPAIAILNREDLTLWVAGPTSSAGMAMPDGVSPRPGGWSRFVLVVDDLESYVSELRDNGVTFRNDIVEQGDASRFSAKIPLATSSSFFRLLRYSRRCVTTSRSS